MDPEPLILYAVIQSMFENVHEYSGLRKNNLTSAFFMNKLNEKDKTMSFRKKAAAQPIFLIFH